MLSPPRDLADDELAAVLAANWDARGPVTYRPVGFGSHHWVAGDHFVTVDEDPDFRQLAASLRSAADVPVAVAPLPARDGAPDAAPARADRRLRGAGTGRRRDRTRGPPRHCCPRTPTRSRRHAPGARSWRRGPTAVGWSSPTASRIPATRC